MKIKNNKTSKIKNITNTAKISKIVEIKREAKCDKCKRLFYRKISNSKGIRRLTRINEINYWLKEGKNWGKFKILCRGCLTDWFEKYRGDFAELIDPEKQKLYYHYRYLGLLSEKKELYAKLIASINLTLRLVKIKDYFLRGKIKVCGGFGKIPGMLWEA